MKKPSAAIDVGSHTARLLIARVSGASNRVDSLLKRRRYIRLAETVGSSKKRIIHANAFDRTTDALSAFVHDIKEYNVGSIEAVATGVVREALNSVSFLNHVEKETGIPVRLLTGEEEAFLTAKGVLYGLGAPTRPFLNFDLGGGSTEFFMEAEGIQISQSIPLGAAVLTNQYLGSDPPEKAQVDSLSRHIDHCLNQLNLDFSKDSENLFVAGTGGTVTTLALMTKGTPAEEAFVEGVEGMRLNAQWVETLFHKMKVMPKKERLTLPGLDEGRVNIILAGCLVVTKILQFVKAHHLTVSVSSLLEGILLNQLEGEQNAK